MIGCTFLLFKICSITDQLLLDTLVSNLCLGKMASYNVCTVLLEIEMGPPIGRLLIIFPSLFIYKIVTDISLKQKLIPIKITSYNCIHYLNYGGGGHTC